MITSWHRVHEVPDEGRVRTAVVDGRTLALCRCGGTAGKLDIHRPHQGWPWHGYNYEPLTGMVPEGSPTRRWPPQVQERTDGHVHGAADALLETFRTRRGPNHVRGRTGRRAALIRPGGTILDIPAATRGHSSSAATRVSRLLGGKRCQTSATVQDRRRRRSVQSAINSFTSDEDMVGENVGTLDRLKSEWRLLTVDVPTPVGR